jgi:hypothetical protein
VAAGSKKYRFAVGTDDSLYMRFNNGSTWLPWTPLGGYLTSSPAAASLGAGHVRVFARGGDGYVYKQYLTAGAPAGTFARRLVALCSALAPAPARAAADPADGAYLDSYGGPQLLDGAASRWLGGRLTANPAVLFQGADVLLAGRGGDGGLWLYDGRPDHSGWVGLGGFLL